MLSLIGVNFTKYCLKRWYRSAQWSKNSFECNFTFLNKINEKHGPPSYLIKIHKRIPRTVINSLESFSSPLVEEETLTSGLTMKYEKCHRSYRGWKSHIRNSRNNVPRIDGMSQCRQCLGLVQLRWGCIYCPGRVCVSRNRSHCGLQ